MEHLNTGDELHPPKTVFQFTSAGSPSPQAAWNIIRNLIKLVGMHPARKGRIDRYPYQGNKGGKGFTIYQPLVESFCTADVYSDHKKTHIVLSTCKPERVNVTKVVQFLEKEIGPTETPDVSDT